MEDNNLKKRLTIEFPATKHMEIKLAATAIGVSMKEFIDRAIEEYIITLKDKR